MLGKKKRTEKKIAKGKQQELLAAGSSDAMIGMYRGLEAF